MGISISMSIGSGIGICDGICVVFALSFVLVFVVAFAISMQSNTGAFQSLSNQSFLGTNTTIPTSGIPYQNN